MNVMQALMDLKQNAHQTPHAANQAAVAKMSGTSNRALSIPSSHPISRLTSGLSAGPASAANSTSAASAASPSDSSTTSSSDSTTITANDFLQLLVAEMKNQDPTADQDPNAYIDQLVQVNSLQQLISINQDLGGNVSGSTSSAAQTAAAKQAIHQPQLGTAEGGPAASVASALDPRSTLPERSKTGGWSPFAPAVGVHSIHPEQ